MFGDMMGMLGKLKEAQKKVEATKERLHTVLIDEASNDNKIKVTINIFRDLFKIFSWNQYPVQILPFLH